MKIKKLRAGALQLTTFIVVVIALLLASFVILIHTHKRFNVQSLFVLETVDNAQKGIAYAIHNQIPLKETSSVDLKDEDYKTLSVHRDFWGLFEKVTATSEIKTHRFTKTALIGATQSPANRTALFVKDNNKPLVVVGHTKIQGTAHLPQRGVRAGNISGKSYYGSRLIYGATQTSNSFPELSLESRQQITRNFTEANLYEQHQFLDLNKEKAFQNSFLNPLQIVYSPGVISLSGISLTGHIKIHSQTKIIVEASALLKDVILVAPVIEIKNGVKGRFQAFASKTLDVGKNCELSYPSALVVQKKETALDNDAKPRAHYGISIQTNATLEGVVLFLGVPKPGNYKPQILIEEGTTISGEVYCTQNLELKGTVYGSVFTNNFIAAQSGSIYQNHIYNASILVDELPVEYVGLPFKKAKKGVMKWLY